MRTVETPGSVSGVVRNSQGAPEPGAMVELLRPNLTVVSETATDHNGHYEFEHLRSGKYDLKASGAFFLPTLRENVQVEGATRMVVNMTLNTLYQAFRWLPAEPRSKQEPPDDWTWTLRLAANRPLLRLLQNGPLVVVADSNGHRALEARVTIRGGDSGFGNGGIHQDIEVARSSNGSRGIVLRADLAGAGQEADPSFSMVAGYEHRSALNDSFRTVGIVEDHPEIAAGPDGQGLSAFALRSAEVMDLMPGVEAQVGDEILGLRSTGMMVANYPFARFTVQNGPTTISYAVATTPDMQRADEVDQFTQLATMAAESNGKLVAEHGLHQAIEVSRTVGKHGHMSVSVYHDRVMNPVVSGGGAMSVADVNSGDVLYDPMTQLMSVAGQGFASTGMMAEVSNRVFRNMWMTLNVATGNALAYAGDGGPAPIAEQVRALAPRESEMVAVSATGKLVNAGTQWRVGYSWQGGGTLTPVAPYYATSSPGPYLSLMVKQPIRCRRVLPNGMEAMVAVRNLLAEGYRPFLSSDGTTLYFAQVSRSIEGGLSFTF